MAHHQKGYQMDIVVFLLLLWTVAHYATKIIKATIDWTLFAVTGKHHDIWEE